MSESVCNARHRVKTSRRLFRETDESPWYQYGEVIYYCERPFEHGGDHAGHDLFYGDYAVWEKDGDIDPRTYA